MIDVTLRSVSQSAQLSIKISNLRNAAWYFTVVAKGYLCTPRKPPVDFKLCFLNK